MGRWGFHGGAVREFLPVPECVDGVSAFRDHGDLTWKSQTELEFDFAKVAGFGKAEGKLQNSNIKLQRNFKIQASNGAIPVIGGTAGTQYFPVYRYHRERNDGLF
jgi:hypothetical protein